ncbi:hypothetical protein [Paraburkholderia sp.]|uniref:hypothetical protein n=1 Tax=Paraburkholderia sp. TaxID=1926495 RepID=UPI0039E5D906
MGYTLAGRVPGRVESEAGRAIFMRQFIGDFLIISSGTAPAKARFPARLSRFDEHKPLNADATQ